MLGSLRSHLPNHGNFPGFAFGTATVMFGALLVRVPDPYTLMSVFHIIYTARVVLSAVCGLFGLAAGSTLLARRGKGCTLAIAAAFLSLSDIPLGVTLGIYTLMVLLPISAARLSRRSGQTP
jgi:hypothetical protein